MPRTRKKPASWCWTVTGSKISTSRPSTKRQLKGNIYLAKVVRVEPSLQAAFVEYGGNRHGFLAFGEIHPDYYQIPVADRQRLLEMQAERGPRGGRGRGGRGRRPRQRRPAQPSAREPRRRRERADDAAAEAAEPRTSPPRSRRPKPPSRG